jgi:predicted dehydrogenase
MKNKILKAGVIGLGIGERHIIGYLLDSRCKVKTICDFDLSKLQEVGSRYPDCKLTLNAHEILEDPEIDVISIASFDNFHAEYILLAIEYGKHVFVEKPLCLNESEYVKIKNALRQNPSIHLSSNLVLRRSPQFNLVKERLIKGFMGKVYYFEGDYNYGRLHKLTEGWRGQIPYYSVVHGGAIHVIDLLLWFTRERVIEVIAIGNNISTKGSQFKYLDMVTALLRFEDGVTAKISANFGSVCPHHHEIKIFGTSGSFIHNYQGGVFYNSREPKAIFEKVNLPFEAMTKGGVQRSFVSQILDGIPAEVSINDVMDTMAVSLAVERSLTSKTWERVYY